MTQGAVRQQHIPQQLTFPLAPRLPPPPGQVLALADSKEARQLVPKWHSTPSGVLIITHEMFAMLGALRLVVLVWVASECRFGPAERAGRLVGLAQHAKLLAPTCLPCPLLLLQ